MPEEKFFWGTCSSKDGLCPHLKQGRNVWDLHPYLSMAGSLQTRLEALQADENRRSSHAEALLQQPSRVLWWSWTQGLVAYQRPCEQDSERESITWAKHEKLRHEYQHCSAWASALCQVGR